MKLEEAIKTNKFLDNKHKATLNLLYTSYWLKYHFNASLKEMKLTVEQFNVLRILNGKYPEQMCVKDIATRLIEKSSNVPRIIDRLLIKKLVKRANSKEDKRETLISITESGLKLLTEANNAMNQLSENIIGIDENDAEVLNVLLEKVRKID